MKDDILAIMYGSNTIQIYFYNNIHYEISAALKLFCFRSVT